MGEDRTPLRLSTRKPRAGAGTSRQQQQQQQPCAAVAVQREAAGEASSVLVLRSRSESPLIITAPCGKITTRGTARFSIQPLYLAFGSQDGGPAAPLKRSSGSPLEDVAKHLVQSSLKKKTTRNNSSAPGPEPVTPIAARDFWTAHRGSTSRDGDASLVKQAATASPFGSPVRSHKNLSQTLGTCFQPTIHLTSPLQQHQHRLRTPVSSRKLKLRASRQLKLRDGQELQQRLHAQVRQEAAMEKQERTYRAWLNFVFTNSAAGNVLDLDRLAVSGITGDKLMSDAWRDCGDKLVMPSPAKMTMGSRKIVAKDRGKGRPEGAFATPAQDAYLQPLCSVEELHRRLLGVGSLDHSQQQEIVSTMLHMAKHVDEGRLRMKQGCVLVNDIALRRKALDVLMAYNAAWLRIGLSVVLGNKAIETLRTADDAYTEVFLERHFLGDLFLAKAYATNKAIEGLYRDGYHDCLASLILKRFLLLALFLDRMKCHTGLQLADGIDGLDGGSPPLFRPGCTVKSSRQAIYEFFSNSMFGEGDFLGHLSTLGYHVFHVQPTLSEYSFHIKGLEDLRDGVLLFRLAQLLSKDRSLLTKLQLPCQTRTKCLENCEAALQVLAEAGVPIQDEEESLIRAEDIVDGVKKKMLSLLWNIVLHLQMPSFITRHRLWEEILRIEKLKGAATAHPFSEGLPSTLHLLLAWVQAICSNYGYSAADFRTSFTDGQALCYLVSFYLPEKFPMHNILSGASYMKVDGEGNELGRSSDSDSEGNGIAPDPEIAAWNFRLLKAVSCKFKSVQQNRFLKDLFEDSGGICEQGVMIYVAFLCSELLCRDTLVHLQNQEGTVLDWASELIAQSFSVSENLESHPNALQGRVSAAIKIQTWYRASRERCKYKGLRAAVLLIQRTLRVWLAKQVQTRMQGQRSDESELIAVQTPHGHLDRALAGIQALFRGWRQRQKFKYILAAVVKIQSTWRARKARANFLEMKSAAVTIQRRWRQLRIFRVQKKHQQIDSAAVRIQAWWRGILVRTFVCRLTAATTVIAKNYRAYVKRKMYEDVRASVVKLQAHVKSRIVRRKFSVCKTAASIIQRCYRRWTAKQKRESRILVAREQAARTIQQAWTCYVRGRNRIRAAVKIQSAYRGWTKRSLYGKARASIIRLQALHRCKTLQLRFSESKRAAQKIQAAFRAYAVRRNIRVWQNAAFLIQTHYRNYRKRLAAQQCAAIKIQRCWRGHIVRTSYLAAKVVHEENLHLRHMLHTERKALEVIAATLKMRRQRAWFLALRKSVIFVQRRWRLYLAARTEAAVRVQRYVRGWITRRSFNRTRQSVIFIQAFWRGCQQREGHTELNLRCSELRKRMQLTALNVEDSMRLGNRLMEALASLLSKKTVSSILKTCETIDYASQHSLFCCERLVEGGAIAKLVELIQTTNRSPPHELVLKHALSTLGNIARFPLLSKYIADDLHFMSVITEQLHMSRNREEVFRSAWRVFQLVCTVSVGVHVLEKTPSVFRRLHVVAQNLEKKIEVEKRNLERLPATTRLTVTHAAERRVIETVLQFETLVDLMKEVIREAQGRRACQQPHAQIVAQGQSQGGVGQHVAKAQSNRSGSVASRRRQQCRLPFTDRSNVTGGS